MQTTKDRVEVLKNEIAKLRDAQDILQNKPLGMTIVANAADLRERERRLVAELNILEPYKVCSYGKHHYVAYKGNFIEDDNDGWLNFASAEAAQKWVNEKMRKYNDS